MSGVDLRKIVRQGQNDILAGSLAGSACKLVEYPLDTVKVQMQTAGSGTSLSNLGPIGLLRMNVREHGFRRLYQGISSPLMGSMAENATLFVSFNLAQSLCHNGPKETMPVHKLVVCAMASGVAVSTVLTPVELIKCRMQTLTTDADFDAIFLDMRFDRAPEGELLGDVEAVTDRHNGDRIATRRFLEDHQGLFVLAALRESGWEHPLLLSYDFDGEPTRWGRLSARHGRVDYLPDNASPADIARRLRRLAGPRASWDGG